MKTSHRAGFTIMETVLFLGITGLLILMIATGTGIALNTQRYQDAVETFKSQVQQQYADLASVQNPRDNATEKLTCGATARPLPVADATQSIDRGQSGCTLAGRYMRIEGGNVTVYNVLAYKNSDPVGNVQDIQVMSGPYFTYNINPEAVSDTDLEWGARASWTTVKGTEQTTGTTTRTMSLLFIRSPYSGQMYTFSSDRVFAKGTMNSTNIKQLIRTAPDPTNGLMGQKERVICIDSAGLVTTGNRSLYITAEATSPSSVETLTNELLKTKVPNGAEAAEC